MKRISSMLRIKKKRTRSINLALAMKIVDLFSNLAGDDEAVIKPRKSIRSGANTPLFNLNQSSNHRNDEEHVTVSKIELEAEMKKIKEEVIEVIP